MDTAGGTGQMRGCGEEERENPKGPEGQEGGKAQAGNRRYLQHRPRFAVRLRLEGRATGITAPPGALGHPGEALAGDSPSLQSRDSGGG